LIDEAILILHLFSAFNICNGSSWVSTYGMIPLVITRSWENMFTSKSAIPRGLFRRKPSHFSVYGLSSWTYSVVGVSLFLYVGEEIHLFEPILWFFQGILSWGNDVLTFGETSYWNILDKIHASAFVFCFCFWFMLMWEFKYTHAALFLSSLLAGSLARTKSILALETRNAHSYLKWHTIWHIAFPLGRVALLVLQL